MESWPLPFGAVRAERAISSATISTALEVIVEHTWFVLIRFEGLPGKFRKEGKLGRDLPKNVATS